MRLTGALGLMASLGFWLAAARVSAVGEASTNAATDFRLLSLMPPAPASSEKVRRVLRLPAVQVTYSGISATWAHRMGRVLTEARSHASREFGFNMPDVLRLTVTTGTNRYELFNDMRDQLTYHLRSEDELAGFDWLHWYFIYGLCHEVAHLAMYRTFDPWVTNAWLNWDGQEAWAHYVGERLADRSYARCVSEFWPGRGVEAEQTLKADRQSAQSFFPRSELQLAGHWRALADIVGDLGLEPVLEKWSKADIDPQHPAEAVSGTLSAHPKAEQLRSWWLKAAPLMLTGPGKSAFPPTARPNSMPRPQPKT